MPRGLPPVTQQRLVAMMKAYHPVPMTPRALEIATGIGKDAVSSALRKLVTRQAVHVVGSTPNPVGRPSPLYSLDPPSAEAGTDGKTP